MNKLNIVCIAIVIITIVLSIAIVLRNNYNTKETMYKLYDMLDCAINGNFNERTFDESILSALEAKLNRYLNQSYLGAKDIEEERDKIKSLISDISHQTKTPIANILLYSSLLEEQVDLPDDIKDMNNQIYTQAEKLNFLIVALIKSSRLETGVISVNSSINSVDKLITELIPQMEQEASKKEIKITTLLSKDIAKFDMKWTSEVVANVIQNAIKYTNKSGEIIISIKAYELFSRIDVKDNGIGINENEYNKIFTRFYRSKDVQQIEGVGIGLFLSREILTSQGGYINVSSKLGEGSTFSIFLPKE